LRISRSPSTARRWPHIERNAMVLGLIIAAIWLLGASLLTYALCSAAKRGDKR
jgi:hypothetical protein